MGSLLENGQKQWGNICHLNGHEKHGGLDNPAIFVGEAIVRLHPAWPEAVLNAEG
jgi:hypothetical protein